jgi:FkbM family methyltransferase
MTPFLGARAGTGVYLMRTRDKHIGKSLFTKEGRGEMHVLTRATAVLTGLYGPTAIKDKVFLDVGANIGTTTIPAVLDHAFGRAIAFEPEEENFVTLRLNTLLNGVDDRVLAIQKAASNEKSMAELVVNPEQGGKHWIATDGDKKSLARATDQIVRVESMAIDDLVTEGVLDPDAAGLIWIDAQGHEGHILDGAESLTTTGVPVVLEWDPRALDVVGDRAKIEEIARRHYTHFAGMRADQTKSGPKFWLRPAAELGEYAQRFLDSSRPESFTDIMLVRLKKKEIPRERQGGVIDLEAMIKDHAPLPAETDVNGAELDPAERARIERRRASRKRERRQKVKEERAKVKAERAKVKRSRSNPQSDG